VARFGAKRMWMGALALFLTGSALCGAAWNIDTLIAFRAVQGIGGGLLIPIMQTLIIQAAGGRPLGKLMATVSMPALVGPILGPVVGGLIVGHANWRWVFYVNPPICLIALALAGWGLAADDPGRTAYRLDVTGLMLIGPGLAAGIFGLSQVAERGGFESAAVVAPLAGCVALLAAFAGHTLRTAAVPVVDLRLFRVRAFSAASALMFLSGLSIYGAMLILPLYYQQARGASVVVAGLSLAPQGLGSLASRPALGRLTDRLGARPVVTGSVLVTLLGTLPFTYAGPGTGQWWLAGALVVRGAGLAGVTLGVMTAAFTGLSRDQVPHASSATRIAQQVGGSFGAAVLAVILRSQTRHGDLAAAFRYSLRASVGFTAIALVPALLLPRPRRRDDAGPAPRPGAPARRGAGPGAYRVRADQRVAAP
jgi:EmrB/QacA subfamily drug resistance transporter